MAACRNWKRYRSSILTTPNSMLGSPMPLSTSQLTDWISRICLGIQVRSPSSSYNVNNLERSQTPIRDLARPEVLPVLRYAVICTNAHYHGMDNHFMFNVTWHEPGSSNTMEPYANVYHLDALTIYDQRLEASSQSGHCKARYFLQRDEERSALASEEDMDSDVSELGRLS
jgi:hypothetical protein